MNRNVELRLDFARVKEAPFYAELDWEALFRMEVQAPYTPVDNDVESDMEAFLLFGRVCAGLRGTALREALRAFGTDWPEVEQAITLSTPLPVEHDPVRRVFIHGQKGRLLDRTDLDPRVVATRSFLQTALVLRCANDVDENCVGRVVDELRRRGVKVTDIDAWRDDARRRLGVEAAPRSAPDP